ncbi:MAG: hypothetical protein O7J95_07190, partial [Planctomycetota bacterium]|nr:hypothetical protein [Planctomycetota bacterium]
FRVRVHEQRIRHGVNPQGNLDAIALITHPAAVRALERHALDPPPGLRRDQALQRLCENFPDSRFPRGMREWESITERSYVGFWPHEIYPDRRPAARSARDLRDWLAAYPAHPGRDNAHLRLAVQVMEESPVEALRLLHDGFHEPDGDKQALIANYFQRVLERHATTEQILGCLETGLGEHLASNLLYVAGLKTMRRRDFRGALELFERFVEAREEHGGLEMKGSWPRWPDCLPPRWRARKRIQEREARARKALLEAIDGQIEVCRSFLSREEDWARATDDETRAGILHEMGRRCFREAEHFLNRFYYEFPRGTGAPRRGWLKLEDIHGANHYRQAAEFFRRIARDYPSYSRLADVEYSIPLCLWRLRRAWQVSLGSRLNDAIWRGFQAFAGKHPQSSMADDALYLAGAHHWLASGRKDSTRIRENMLAIAKNHADGDIVQRFGKKNRWLRAAIEEQRLETE